MAAVDAVGRLGGRSGSGLVRSGAAAAGLGGAIAARSCLPESSVANAAPDPSNFGNLSDAPCSIAFARTNEAPVFMPAHRHARAASCVARRFSFESSHLGTPA